MKGKQEGIKQGGLGDAQGKPAVISLAMEIGQLLTSRPAHTRVRIVREVRRLRIGQHRNSTTLKS